MGIRNRNGGYGIRYPKECGGNAYPLSGNAVPIPYIKLIIQTPTHGFEVPIHVNRAINHELNAPTVLALYTRDICYDAYMSLPL